MHGENLCATWGDSSKLQSDLNFAFDQRESEVNLHKATSLPESPSNVRPGYSIQNAIIKYLFIKP